jgi:hypothetical protein
VNELLIEIESLSESRVSTVHTQTSTYPMLVGNFGNNVTWSLYTFEWMKYIYIPPKSSVEWIVNLDLKLMRIPCFRHPDMEIIILLCGLIISEIMLLDNYIPLNEIYLYTPQMLSWMDCEFKFEVDLDPVFPPSGHKHPHVRCGLIISEIMLLDNYIPLNEWNIFIYPPNVELNGLWI